MSTNLNAKAVAHVEKQVGLMDIDKTNGASTQLSASKNRKKK